jgi:hypothetical protein
LDRFKGMVAGGTGVLICRHRHIPFEVVKI